MVLFYTIAVTKNSTTIYMKVHYDCLSQKQKMHRGIVKPPTKPCVLVKKIDVEIPYK